MPRNFFERCEVMFPIRDLQLRSRLRHEILASYLADTTKARLLCSDGSYVYANQTAAGKAAPAFDAQEFLMRLAEGKVSVEEIPGPIDSRPVKAARSGTASGTRNAASNATKKLRQASAGRKKPASKVAADGAGDRGSAKADADGNRAADR